MCVCLPSRWVWGKNFFTKWRKENFGSDENVDYLGCGDDFMSSCNILECQKVYTF